MYQPHHMARILLVPVQLRANTHRPGAMFEEGHNRLKRVAFTSNHGILASPSTHCYSQLRYIIRCRRAQGLETQAGRDLGEPESHLKRLACAHDLGMLVHQFGKVYIVTALACPQKISSIRT